MRRVLLVALLAACGGPAAEREPTASTGAEASSTSGEVQADGPSAEVVAPGAIDATRACSAASDCVLLTDACGAPAAANAAHAAEVAEQYRALACCVSCAAPPPGTAHAECVAGACAAVRDLPAAGS